MRETTGVSGGIAVALIGLALAGCSTYDKPGAGQAEFKRDWSDCSRSAPIIPTALAPPANADFLTQARYRDQAASLGWLGINIQDNCMRAKGWSTGLGFSG